MNIPQELLYHIKSPDVKKVFFTEAPKLMIPVCENCGGLRRIHIFLATKGPFPSPAGPYAHEQGEGEKDRKLTSHADIINGEPVWWVGYGLSAPCPNCYETQAPDENRMNPWARKDFD